MDINKLTEGITEHLGTSDLLLSVAESRITVCGHELVIDMTDSAVMERYQKASQDYKDALDDASEMSFSSSYAKNDHHCRLVEEYIDGVFGEGTSKEVFDGHHTSFAYHYDAVLKIAEAAGRAAKVMNDIGNTTNQKVAAQVKKQNAQQFRNFAGQQSRRSHGGKRRR